MRYDKMSVKGRVRYLSKHMPSSLGQMLVQTFDERMWTRILRILESGAFEALP